MVRTCAVLVILLGLLPSQLQAERFLLFPFDPGLSLFMGSYLEDPRPERALEVFFETDLAEFERKAEATDQTHSRAILIAFYVQILNINPDLVLPFAARLTSGGTPAHASVGVDLIAAASTPDRAEALELVMTKFSFPPEARETVKSKEVFDYHVLRADHPQTLDLLWACFFSSGDQEFVRSIVEPLRGHPVTQEKATQRIRALAANKPQPGTPEYREVFALLLGEAVRMGLRDNAQTHPTVRAVVEKLALEEGETLGAILKPMLRSGGE